MRLATRIWSRIRELRAVRPGRAADDDERAAVFGAALQQFEELMAAASSVGYAARPLPLFYAISQAGRAIASAHAGDPWELSGHGLKHTLRDPIFASLIAPKPDAKDSFSHVCACLSQDPLTKPVELGALWASLPEFWGIDLPGDQWHRALRAQPPITEFAVHNLTGSIPAVICGLLHRSFEGLSDGDSTEALKSELAYYPGARDWEPSVRTPHPDEFGRHADVRWPAENAVTKLRVLEQRTPQYRVRGQHWLRPVLNESNDFLSPLMTWWALLFGLSSLARYHPAPWIHALRRDGNKDAVPLETTMDEALQAVPHLVLEALEGKTILTNAA